MRVTLAANDHNYHMSRKPAQRKDGGGGNVVIENIPNEHRSFEGREVLQLLPFLNQ